MTKINLEKWKVSLPIYPSIELSDNSTEAEYSRCPRRGFLRYGLRRGGFGDNWPIQFGLAYHKYRELVQNLIDKSDDKLLSDEIHKEAYTKAKEGFENPPFDHRYKFLDKMRLKKSCELARDLIRRQILQKSILVLQTEDSFDLELPFVICESCGWTELGIVHEICVQCGSDVVIARHGGRVDQFIKMLATGGTKMIKDFKSTSRMGKGYSRQFKVSSQMQGYKWAGDQLSGDNFEVVVETLYNTEKEGPKIEQFHYTYTKGMQEAWLVGRMMERQILALMWGRVNELGYLAFPQRTNACQDYGGCGFFDLCANSGTSARAIERWLEENTIPSHWDFANPEEEAGSF